MMPTTFKPAWIFFPFTLIFAALYIREPQEGVLAGMVYSAMMGFRFKSALRPREVFPFVMLFLFLAGLAISPVRGFSQTLIYTVQFLIVFRGLLLSLVQVRNRATPFNRADGMWSLGLGVEFLMLLTLMFSTFRQGSALLIEGSHLLMVRLLSFLAICFTPLFIPGLLFSVGLFFPHVSPYALMGIAMLEVGYVLKVKTHASNHG